jgi:16S rRNA (cytosine967-C5)-methyltransferase
MRIHSHFNTAVLIISKYDGKIPLAQFLKQYFSQQKKHGSRDRKTISHFCYCFYRLGKALKEIDTSERLKIALFLCNENVDEYSDLFDENWKENGSNNLSERIKFIQKFYPNFSIENIFPFENELSESIDFTALAQSHLIQPDLFLRIRPNKEEIVLRKLNDANISFQQINSTCLKLQNASKIEAVLLVNEEVVVQDYSSQKITEFIELSNANHQPQTTNHQPKLWDCCAASGGKSILAKDVLKNISLTVSDLRPFIINNLQKRFKDAGIKNYRSFVADLTTNYQPPTTNFDLIICDAPCSGSGTWARTPEQLYFFEKNEIEKYALLQRKIISNVIPSLAKDGYFLYITCSVFKKENEDAVEFIQQKFSLQRIKKEILKGCEMKADTMFAALFKKN